LNEVGTDSSGSGAFSYYAVLAAAAIFAVLLAWTLMRPPGRRRRVAAAITSISFLLVFVPLLVALIAR
jgi:hypothetical protein